MESVFPVEVQIPSLRNMIEEGLGEDEWIQTKLDQASQFFSVSIKNEWRSRRGQQKYQEDCAENGGNL